MIRLLSILAFLSLNAPVTMARDCRQISTELELPKKLKARGNPPIASQKDVDWTLHDLEKALQGSQCSLTFGQVFQMKKDEELFPLTNRVIEMAPEGTFMGLEVVTKEGVELGTYEGRIRFEKSGGLYRKNSITLYYFQYRGTDGQIHSVGNSLLLDNFGVRWSDIRDKVAVAVK